MKVEVLQADVTTLDVDAIANAALVAFGTGVGGFPLEEAAQLMVGAVGAHPAGSLDRVVFAVHGDEAELAFATAVES